MNGGFDPFVHTRVQPLEAFVNNTLAYKSDMFSLTESPQNERREPTVNKHTITLVIYLFRTWRAIFTCKELLRQIY